MRGTDGHGKSPLILSHHFPFIHRLFCVKYSMDSKFILSGSDDGNIRLWKSKASEKLGPIGFRERAHLQYSEKLKDRYEHMPEVRRVVKYVLDVVRGTRESVLISAKERKREDISNPLTLQSPLLLGTDMYPRLLPKPARPRGLLWTLERSRRPTDDFTVLQGPFLWRLSARSLSCMWKSNSRREKGIEEREIGCL